MKRKLAALALTFSMCFTLLSGYILPVEAAEAKPVNVSNSLDTRSRLGINLEGLADWSGARMFTDMMKTARTWGTADIPWSALSAADVDQYGWPKVDCGLILGHGVAIEPGTYKLSFECNNAAGVEFSPHSSVFSIENIVREGNTVTADIIMPENQEVFMLQFRKTEGGIRNLTCLRPGYSDASQLFTDEFLKFIEPFSTLRFMDYLNTNGQNNGSDLSQIEWANRKTAQHASQAANIGRATGGCYEYLVELVNLTRKDAWINVPYNASDDYIRKLAKFLKENVDEGINVYVEMSNEVWNWSFQQSYVNDALSKVDPIANTYVLQFAKQTANMAEIFREVYGQEAMNNEIRVILAWQIGWAPADAMPRQMLDYIQKHHDTPSNLIYALAGAPYFSEPKPEDCTSNDVIHEHMINSSDASVTGKKQYIQAAIDWNLKGGATCYEGGPHHQGQVFDNLDTRKEAHRHERMQEIVVRDMQKNWFDIGGGLFCYFSATGGYSQYGCWALSENVEDLTTPKYKAIMQMYNENKTYEAGPNPSYVPVMPDPAYADGKILVAYDGFESTSGTALKDHGAGYGWDGSWKVSNDPEQGYEIASENPLAPADLVSAGNYAIGGYAYNTAHRVIDTYRASLAPLRNADGTLGKPGTTIWAGFLMNIQSSSTMFGLINKDTTENSTGLYVGKTSASKDYISMTFEDKSSSSRVALDSGNVFYAIKYVFNEDGSTTISCWLNPSLSANEPEGRANMTFTTTSPVGIKSLVWYAGNKQNNGMLDEIRLGTSYDMISPSTYREPALATPAPEQPEDSLDAAEVIYRYNFNPNSTGPMWSGDTFSIETDPADPTNKVLAHKDTAWTRATSGFFAQNCDPDQVYTLTFRAYGDIGHFGLSSNEAWDFAESSNDKVTAKGIITVDRAHYEGVYERPVSNEWNTYVVTFKGSSQYRFTLMSQCDSNMNGGTALFDDFVIYKGDYYDELAGTVDDDVPTAKPTVQPTLQPTVQPTPPVQPTASAKPTPPAQPTPSTEPTDGPTGLPTDEITPTPNVDSPALKKAKEAALSAIDKLNLPENYRDAEKALLEQAIADAKAAIEAATDIKAVQTLLDSAKTSIAEIKTDSQLTAEESGVKKIKFAKKKIKVKVGKKVSLKAKLTPKKLNKSQKKVAWSIDKKGKKFVKFTKSAKKLAGKTKVQIKAVKKGTAKITCKAPSGKKAICKIVVK